MILPDADDGPPRDGSHNGMLVDFAYTQKRGAKMVATVPRYKSFYPPDPLDVKTASVGLDLYMATMSFNKLLGGSGINIPPSVPREIAGLLRACWLGMAQRSNDTYELFEDFGAALKALFGPPKFRPFVMPSKK
jgi:hypothetical protein